MVKFKSFDTNSIIIKKDDPGDSMFVIIDGIAEVTSPDGNLVYANLSVNSFFGEVCVFYEVNRTATVRAKVQTTVLELSKSSLRSALEEYPELKETIMNSAKENFDNFIKRQEGAAYGNQIQNTEELETATLIERLKRVFFGSFKWYRFQYLKDAPMIFLGLLACRVSSKISKKVN